MRRNHYKLKSEILHKGDLVLPPVKETYKKTIESSRVVTAKQIFLNFTGRLDMSNSPKHIRIPKQKNDLELRYSTKSQMDSFDEKKGKQKLFNPPISMEKDYLTKKISRTVKHYFALKRTSLDGFDVNDLKDKNETDFLRGGIKRGLLLPEFESDNRKEEKSSGNNQFDFKNLKGLRNSAMLSQFSAQKEEVERKNRKDKKNGSLKTKTFHKVDQSLQTDESLIKESEYSRRGITKHSLYQIEDNLSESNKSL